MLITPSYSKLSKVPLSSSTEDRVILPSGWKSKQYQVVYVNLSEDSSSELLVPLDVSYGILDHIDLFFTEDQWGNLMYLSCFPYCIIESFELVCMDEDIDYYSGKDLFLHNLFEENANTTCLRYITPPIFIRNQIPELVLRIRFRPMEQFYYELLPYTEKQNQVLQESLSFLPLEIINQIQEYGNLFSFHTNIIVLTKTILPDSALIRQLCSQEEILCEHRRLNPIWNEIVPYTDRYSAQVSVEDLPFLIIELENPTTGFPYQVYDVKENPLVQFSLYFFPQGGVMDTDPLYYADIKEVRMVKPPSCYQTVYVFMLQDKILSPGSGTYVILFHLTPEKKDQYPQLRIRFWTIQERSYTLEPI